MNAYWLGTPADTSNAASMQFSDSFFPPLKSQYFFNRCGTDSIQEMQGETAPALFGDFSQGMFDYNTQNYDFQEIFTSLMNFWIAYADVDGFRIDAAKHVTAGKMFFFTLLQNGYMKHENRVSNSSSE